MRRLVSGSGKMADAVQKVAFDAKLMVGPRIVQQALGRGVILRRVGDTVTFYPPLIIARSEIDLLSDAVTEALDVVVGELTQKKSRKVA
jgi:adenosylmethionine-8-amino-7-oxononanoate aminotransferase